MTNNDDAEIDVTLNAVRGGPITIEATCDGAKMTLEFTAEAAGGVEVLTQNAEKIAAQALDAALAKIASEEDW